MQVLVGNGAGYVKQIKIKKDFQLHNKEIVPKA